MISSFWTKRIVNIIGLGIDENQFIVYAKLTQKSTLELFYTCNAFHGFAMTFANFVYLIFDTRASVTLNLFVGTISATSTIAWHYHSSSV